MAAFACGARPFAWCSLARLIQFFALGSKRTALWKGSSAASRSPADARATPRLPHAWPWSGLAESALRSSAISSLASPPSPTSTARLKQASASSLVIASERRYASTAPSLFPRSLSTLPSEYQASLSSGSSARLRRSFSSAASASAGDSGPPLACAVMASAQFLRHVAQRGLSLSAHLKSRLALARSPRPRAARPWFCSRRTCSTRSSMSKKAPRMYRSPAVTGWPPCRTEPGRKVQWPCSIGRTDPSPRCSKKVPPPV
mmetsp:Transcript_12105/g.39844  ORF Transcript_12105/g.39844 Transcript_12105/m.39844 type:complete len:259 (-) Transcript_12105:906-1682(-)